MEISGMSEKTYNYTAICCEKIPELFLDKLVARKHFSQYGHITRFILRPRRLSCTVAFETEAQAERALMEGSIYNGHKFDIEYAEHETNNVQNTEDWINSEVQSELDAISNVWHTAPQLTSFPPKFVNSVLRPAKSTSPTFAHVTAGTSASYKVNSASEQQQKQQQTRNVSPAVRQELVALMRKPAYTAEEKYRVLDARDKLMRITNLRKTKVVKTKATKGTCTDMCPEKERQMREFQRQVATFELSHTDDQRISHKRAIKEYSRSSADQEAPLAHELRSEVTLNMTMAYMMHNIMDLCDDTEIAIGDWFHFVWDRTRSIRKEITQQELCSLNAVKLVEQCARFHIHCAARLVAEEPSVFDTKINAENLTKCLQTLKYMYHDLRLNNIACPSEPEFRSYVVLLNLRDANFLWEIKQLPVHIQKSNDIRRAILFYNALQDNNFVRFFNMIRETETSYLSACILLGYFNRLRVRAMEILIKSHKWSKNNAFLPLPLITRALGFEDELATQDFLEAHGLQCDSERVLLDRMTMPETEYKMERAKYLIESKRTVSVGECICGEPLPSADIFERHVPCNSFDENGLLKPEAWQVEDDLSPNSVEPQKKPDTNLQRNSFGTMAQAPNVQTITPPQQMHHHTKTMSDNIFKIPQASPPISPKQQIQQQQQTKNVFGFGFTMAQNIAPTTMHITTPTTMLTTAEIMMKTMRDEEEAKLKSAVEEARLCAEVAAKARAVEAASRARAEAARAAAEARATEEQRRRQERAALEKRAMELMNEFVYEIVRHEVTLISTEVFADELRRQKSCQLVSNVIFDQILKQLVVDEVRQVHADLYYEKRLLRRCFDEWTEFTRKQQDERRLLETTPLWLTSTTRQEQVAQIALPEQMSAKNLMRRYRLGTACNFSALLQRLPNAKETHTKLNLWSLLASTLPLQKLGAQRYFKLLCTLPAEDEEMPGFKNLCERWLNRNLMLRPGQQQTVMNTTNDDVIRDDKMGSNGTVDSGEGYINEMAYNVALCVRKMCGVVPFNERGERAKPEELANSDGIVCFLTPNDLKRTRDRLRNVSGISRRIVFLVYNGHNCEEATLVHQLNLNNLSFDAYKFYGCHITKSNFNFAGLFRNAIKFLARRSTSRGSVDNIDYELEQQALPAFTNMHLGEEQWQRWLFSVSKNPSFREVCKKPNFVVQLFNEATSRLQKIASVDFRHAKRFPYELQRFVPPKAIDGIHKLEHFVSGWHTSTYRRHLITFFDSIKLPAMPTFDGDKTSLQDFEQFEQSIYLWLLDYGHACLPQCRERATQTAYAAIQALVTQMNQHNAQSLTPLERLGELNYLPIIKYFANERLYMSLRTKQRPPAIIYRLPQLRCYQETPWWLNYAPVSEVLFDGAALKYIECSQPNDEALSSIELPDFTALIAKASAVAAQTEIRPGKRKACATNHFNELTWNLDESIRKFERNAELTNTKDSNKYENYDDNLRNLNNSKENEEEEQQKCYIKADKSGNENAPPLAGVATDQMTLHKRVKYKHETTITRSEIDTLQDTIKRARSLINRIDEQMDERRRRELHDNPFKY